MEYVEAGNATIPKVGLGTWQLTGSACIQTIQTALEVGYRHIDTAQAYKNERAIGTGIAASDVDREEIFLTTKVRRSNLHREDVLASVRGSLDRLGVEYVDLLLIHKPHPRIPIEETLGAMTELYYKGLVDHLGVSNFSRSQLQEAIRATDTPIVTNQVRYHPYEDQSGLLAFCVDNNIALTAHSPLAMGAAIHDKLFERIGRQYHKTAPQIVLRWLTQQDNVVAVPKASSPEHLAENLAIWDFSLTDEEMARITEYTGGLEARLRLWVTDIFPSLLR